MNPPPAWALSTQVEKMGYETVTRETENDRNDLDGRKYLTRP